MKLCANCGVEERFHTVCERALCEEITGETFTEGGFSATSITMGAWALLADLRDALVAVRDTPTDEAAALLGRRRGDFERELLEHPEWFAVKPSKRCMVTKIFPFKGGESEHRCIRPAGHEGDHDFGVRR